MVPTFTLYPRISIGTRISRTPAGFIIAQAGDQGKHIVVRMRQGAQGIGLRLADLRFVFKLQMGSPTFARRLKVKGCGSGV